MLRPFVAPLALLTLALAACGGDDEIEPSARPTSSVMETMAPTVTPGVPGPPRLAYDDENGVVWLVSGDGGERRRLTDRCGAIQMRWSPDGNLLACSYFAISVFDLDGREVWRKENTPGAGFLAWAPDSRHIAYRDSDAAIHVADVVKGTDAYISPNGIPIEWLGDSLLLAGLEVEDGDLYMHYKGYLLDVNSGEAARRPYFDDNWLSVFPDRSRAVAFPDANSMAIYDFASGEERPVNGPALRAVAISPDGEYFFGADARTVPATIYSCDVEIAQCNVLGTVPGVLLSISGEGLVSFLKPGGIPEKMSIADLRSGRTVEIGLGTHMAWWP